MAEKGIECEIEQINIVKGENLSDDFLVINPRGLLPVLVLDDGTILTESVAICFYLESIYPDPSLMGRTPIEIAHITARQREMEFDGLLPAAEVFRNSYPGFAKRGIGGNVGEVDAIPALADRGRASLLRWYRRLDEHLAHDQFIVGDKFTNADIAALCALDFATSAARVPVSNEFKNLKHWHAEVSARPSTQIEL